MTFFIQYKPYIILCEKGYTAIMSLVSIYDVIEKKYDIGRICKLWWPR